MPQWLIDVIDKSGAFMPHGHCYFWIPSLLWLHVASDLLIGAAYAGISLILVLLVRKIRLPFSPVFVAFGLFIGLCGLTHFIAVWTVWNPDYWVSGLVKAATATASVATAIGLVFVRPQVEELVHAARLSEERRIALESNNAEINALYQKVKELDELKMQFYANVSHELRTPLALIIGPTEHLLGDESLNADQKRQLESISRNSKVLLKQVNDLLDVAKIEAGEMGTQSVRFDLVPLFQQVCSQFEVAAEQKGVQMLAVAPDELLVQADPDMIERIIVNLLANAFKFTPAQGEVRIELAEADDSFLISVADTGPGIDQTQHQAIFERFRQADGGTTRRYGGTGLGLAIVKDFVQFHGGKVEVDSAPDKGAKFSVRIPRIAKQQAGTGSSASGRSPSAQVAIESALVEIASSAQPAGGRGLTSTNAEQPTVLVVEDTAEMSELIATSLGSDYNIVRAYDGREGLETALALQPDVIVTDLMMPRMGGDQLVTELRKHSVFDAVPILLLTAKHDAELRVKLLQSGAQDYVSKPFLPQELKARVHNLIAVKRAGDALRRELMSCSNDIEGLARELTVQHSQIRLALEATEVAREQAERASEVKSHFLAMVSHELRTPLSTIVMSAQLLSRQAEGPGADSLRPRLERMARATQQLSTLVEGVLEYTRVESGKIALKYEPVDVISLAEEVMNITQLQVPATSVQLKLAPPDGPITRIHTDPRLLRVMLNNLLSNAVKFTQEGIVTLRVAQDSQWCRLEVVDTGIGIHPADIPRIFLPFEQVEPVQRKSIPGVGLGLALTKELAEALGGAVSVTSEAGAGSTFTIRLPLVAST